MKGIPAALLAFALMFGVSRGQEGFPPPVQDDTFTFALKLTDELIADLKRNPEGLISLIPAESRGKISRVRVYYEPPVFDGRGVGSFDSDFGNGERVASSRPPTLTEPPPQDRNSGGSILDQLPDPSQMGRSTASSPSNPVGGFGNTGTGGSNQFPSGSGTAMVPFGNPLPPSSFPSGPPSSSPSLASNPPLGGTNSLEAQRNQWKQEADRYQAERKAEEEQQRLIDDIVEQRVRLEREKMMRELQTAQRSNLENQSLYNPPSAQGTIGSPFAPPTSVGNGSVLAPYQPPSTGFGNGRTVTQVALNPTPSDAATDPGLILPPGTGRTPATSAGTEKSLADAERLADSKTNGALLLMLLCSVALNIYLGWIARGFYVRYADLADELRETFSATV